MLAVTDAQYEAIHGVGGACDPTTDERLVRTTRPGLELVISTPKSVAELGVIGRAEDMHCILDAERDATLAYLDDLTRRIGGRRGREAKRSPTDGLVYAVARHVTSRAGDPFVHDHVLVANVVRMGDARGGWKAADTTLPCGGSTSTPPPWSAAWPPPEWRWSSAMGSWPIRDRRAAWGTGPSPASPRS